MIRTCLFLTLCVLVFVQASADWRHVSPNNEPGRRPHYKLEEPEIWVHGPVRKTPLIKSTTNAFETEFDNQNNERIAERDQLKCAIIIGGTVGGGVILILIIVIVALVIRNKRRRREKVIEKQSKPITNPRYQISIINPKLRGPPPAYDNADFKNGNSKADEYDVNNQMNDVKDSKLYNLAGVNAKSCKDPKFEDLYNHLNATDVQNVHKNLYKRGDSTDDSNGDEADIELSDEVEVPETCKESAANPGPADHNAKTMPSK